MEFGDHAGRRRLGDDEDPRHVGGHPAQLPGDLPPGRSALPDVQHDRIDPPRRRDGPITLLDPDVRPVLLETRHVLTARDQCDPPVAEIPEVVHGEFDRRVEVDVDVVQALRVGRSADDRERDVECLEAIDAGVVELDLHQQDAVDQALTDQLGQLGAVVADRPDDQVVLAGTRLAGRAGDELADRTGQPVLQRRVGERDDPGAATGQRPRHDVASEAELGHRRLDPIAGRAPTPACCCSRRTRPWRSTRPPARRRRASWPCPDPPSAQHSCRRAATPLHRLRQRS